MNSWCTLLEYFFTSTLPSIRSSTTSSHPSIGRHLKRRPVGRLTVEKYKKFKVEDLKITELWEVKSALKERYRVNVVDPFGATNLHILVAPTIHTNNTKKKIFTWMF